MLKFCRLMADSVTVAKICVGHISRADLPVLSPGTPLHLFSPQSHLYSCEVLAMFMLCWRIEPRHEKTCLRSFRRGPTQT